MDTIKKPDTRNLKIHLPSQGFYNIHMVRIKKLLAGDSVEYRYRWSATSIPFIYTYDIDIVVLGKK